MLNPFGNLRVKASIYVYIMLNYEKIVKGFFFLILFVPLSVKASNPLDIVVNELAWMGTTHSPNDEWMELYNNTENPINLDGWRLVAQDGTPKINISGTIPANGFYLLERTNDETVPGISADKIYTGALSNSGENLKLYDNLNNVIDEVNCSAGWFTGLGKPEYKTMERKNPQLSDSDSSNWQTSQNSGGTPNSKNSVFAENEIVDVKPRQYQDEPKPKEEKPKPIISSGIVINEILPSPEGADEKEEWIEIFNQNNFEVDLSGWQIADTTDKIYTFLIGTKISAQGFLVLFRPETKITLNNDEDGLSLIQPNGNILDNVNYQKPPQGQSLNRIEDGWVWSSALTPGSANIIPAPSAKIKNEEKNKEKPQKELAAVSESFRQIQEKQISKPLFTFLVALGLAIFSGVIVLMVKKKLKNTSGAD